MALSTLSSEALRYKNHPCTWLDFRAVAAKLQLGGLDLRY